jgi:large subunit ribosomal protein L30
MAETKKATKKKDTAAKKITIQYFRSAIGFNVNQKLVIKGLGFRKLNAKREVLDTPSIRGMIATVPHLVRVVE